MSAEARKAYLEWTGKDTLRITTPYKQRVFSLPKRSVIINLIDLQIVPGYNEEWYFADPPSPFFAHIIYEDKEDKFWADIFAYIAEDNLDIIGVSDWKEGNKQVFKVNMWVP